MTKTQKSRLLVIVYIVLLAVTVIILMRFGMTQEPEVQKIGFIMSTSAEGDGARFYEGVKTACGNVGVELLVRDNVPDSDGACVEAVSQLVAEGAEMIILSSAGYSSEMALHFAEYPAVTFYGIFASDFSFDVPNLTSYSTRMYQARYLSGIVAGMYSKTGRIGFVAPERSCEVCRNIDAFALGVRRVAPEAEVVVSFVSEDETATYAARTLIWKEQVDVITYHQNQHNVLDVAEQAGIASISYYEQVEGVSDRCLACVACDWSILYEQLLREYLRGRSGNVVNEWLDLSSRAVELTGYSPRVSQEARLEVEAARQEILSGKDVFTGEIRDNYGSLRCREGESIPDETLLRNIYWMAEGVRVYD